MKIPISPRLLACAGFVPAGAQVADIGCDHGYLGIYLLSRPNGANRVIAADVREGPLACAVKNAEKFGFTDKMSFHLSDGVQNIPRDFDHLVCAGMGADTIISILSAAPWLQDARYHLILQCQSKRQDLRRYLSEHGWRIEEESVLRDGRFLYTVMDVCYQPGCQMLTPGQWYFPPAMLENPSRETVEYYHRTLRDLHLAISARGEKAEPALSAILAELEQLPQNPDLSFLKEETP